MSITFSSCPILYKHSAGEQRLCYSFSHKCASEAIDINSKNPRIYVLGMLPGQMIDLFTRTMRTFVSPSATAIHHIRTDWVLTKRNLDDSTEELPKSKVSIVLIGMIKVPLAVLTTPIFVAIQLIIEVGHLLKVILIIPIGMVMPKNNDLFLTLSNADRTVPRTSTVLNRKSMFPDDEKSNKLNQQAAITEELKHRHEKNIAPPQKILETSSNKPQQDYIAFVKYFVDELFGNSLGEAAAIGHFSNNKKMFEKANASDKQIRVIEIEFGWKQTSYIEELKKEKYIKYFSNFTIKFKEAFLEKLSQSNISTLNSSLKHQDLLDIQKQITTIFEEFHKITNACGKENEVEIVAAAITEKYPILELSINSFIKINFKSKQEIDKIPEDSGNPK